VVPSEFLDADLEVREVFFLPTLLLPRPEKEALSQAASFPFPLRPGRL